MQLNGDCRLVKTVQCQTKGSLVVVCAMKICK